VASAETQKNFDENSHGGLSTAGQLQQKVSRGLDVSCVKLVVADEVCIVCMGVCVCVCVCMRAYVCMGLCMRLYTYLFVYICRCVYICINIHKQIYLC